MSTALTKEEELNRTFEAGHKENAPEERTLIGNILDLFKENKITKAEAERQILWIEKCNRDPRLAMLFAKSSKNTNE